MRATTALAEARDLAQQIADQLQSLGPVEITRFFGGAGLRFADRQFGFVMKRDLYLRVDDSSRPTFEEMGQRPFTYTNRSGTVTVASYYTVPDEISADSAALVRWASEACRASLSIRTSPRTSTGGHLAQHIPTAN